MSGKAMHKSVLSLLVGVPGGIHPSTPMDRYLLPDIFVHDFMGLYFMETVFRNLLFLMVKLKLKIHYS